MCGYLCTGCGKCGVTKSRVKPFGTCLKCGFVNEPGADACAHCGVELVKLPGQSAASGHRGSGSASSYQTMTLNG